LDKVTDALGMGMKDEEILILGGVKPLFICACLFGTLKEARGYNHLCLMSSPLGSHFPISL
jgi:hypothetical protein